MDRFECESVSGYGGKPMNLEVTHNIQDNTYHWHLYTGPDGIDEYDGISISLGSAFEEIIQSITLNGLSYVSDASSSQIVHSSYHSHY